MKKLSWVVIGLLVFMLLLAFALIDFNPEPCASVFCQDSDIPKGYATIPGDIKKWQAFFSGQSSFSDLVCFTPPMKYFLTHSDYCVRETPAKPVIYLYPEKKEDVRVQLDFNGIFTSTYPTYNSAIGGWNVIASPDGTLINKDDGKEYSYLFWEGSQNNHPYNFSQGGFVVAGKDTKDFFQATLGKIGLTPREYNEFIVYWLPQLEHNPYNEIYFAGQEYSDNAKLTITPKPDSMLRVFMVYKPLSEKISLPTQNLTSFERKGFSVIEWGGAELK
jgi:hypothetical protein